MIKYSQFLLEQEGTDLIKLLHKGLCNTFVLYTMTHTYHWNVVGDSFYELHKLFEDQYNELWNALDDLAEQIRKEGEYVDFMLENVIETASVKQKNASNKNEMLKNLFDANKICSNDFQRLIDLANKNNNQVILDLAQKRKAEHDKNIWFLGNFLVK